MLAQSEERSRVGAGGLVPDTQQVVVRTTRQIPAVTRPLQATDLLSVSQV